MCRKTCQIILGEGNVINFFWMLHTTLAFLELRQKSCITPSDHYYLYDIAIVHYLACVGKHAK
jgi:hypothetical protein